MLVIFAVFVVLATALPPLDLTYFDGRGRAEQFRLWFADQKQEYRDIRLTGAQFETLKKTFPYGHVPVINSTQINNGNYLADTAGLNVWLGRSTGNWPVDFVKEAILLDYSGASEDLRLSRSATNM